MKEAFIQINPRDNVAVALLSLIHIYGKYRIKKNDDWTNGFWTGMLWMAYMHTGDEAFRELAMKNVESFKERLDAHFVLDHHDIGFLYSPSVVAALKVTGDDRLICQILRAADVLSARFQEKGGRCV